MRASVISLPRGWTRATKTALRHTEIVTARGRAALAIHPHRRQRVRIKQLKAQLSLLREEQRIKVARILRIEPFKQLHCPPTERLAILELKAARRWSLAQTANRFHLKSATIAPWMKRLDEQGPGELIQLPQPVNKFPQFVEYLVARLKAFARRSAKERLPKR